jgi:DNA repair exonuclease SbcCD ATPase subunit
MNVKGTYQHNRSLASFEYIHIKGVGPHKDTRIDFTDPIIAISGENGTGKTIFMESMFALLYGHLPSYGKVDHISDKVASIEGSFRTNKDLYRVLRTFNGKDKKAFVWKNDSEKPIMGPKISEVKKFMEKIVGPEELLLSSVFSTQFYAGDIVDLDPGNRKEIFNKLLGLENLAEVKDVIDDKLKDMVKKKDVLTGQYGAMSTVEQLEVSIIHITKDNLTNRSDLLKEKMLSLSKELVTKSNYETQMKDYQKNISDTKMCIASKQDEITKREAYGDSKALESKLQGCEKVLTNFNLLFLKQKKDYEKHKKNIIEPIRICRLLKISIRKPRNR